MSTTSAQQIYLRRSLHSAAQYLGYKCHLATNPQERAEFHEGADLPSEALHSSYLHMQYTQPENTEELRQHPSVTFIWHDATFTTFEGQGTSLATYIEGLAREILARMGAGGPESQGRQGGQS